jgi:hypothetical protein
MIWAAIVYTAAAVVIGRVVWEFDAYAEEPATIENRRVEVRLCVLTGVVWPYLLIHWLWVHVSTPRPTDG